MSLTVSSSVNGTDPQFAEISRRLAGLVWAPTRLVPYGRGAAPHAATVWRGQWTTAEKSAAAFYESVGYEVIRLSHETSTSVGQPYEARVPGAAQLAEALHRILPANVVRTWTSRSPKPEESLTLNGVDPRDYPVSGYPPDFLCARSGDWRLVEVKGPGDSIHFRQANWLVHRREPEWPFEVCMPMQGLAEARFVPDEIRPGPAFTATYQAELEEVLDYRTMMSMSRLSGAALAEAEDRNASSIVRYRRRLWAGLLAKGNDPRSLSMLRSGRSMSVLDPNWPPQLTEADLTRMAQRAAKDAENKKRLAAYEREAKQKRRKPRESA